jgi:hypothetical protein
MSIRDAALSVVSRNSVRNTLPRPWSDGIVLASVFAPTGNTTITASSTTHTKGSWSQLVASTSAESSGLLLFASGNAVTSTATSMLLDIGTGAAGSESVIVPDIALGGANGYRVLIPIRIPSGVRVAARCQSAVASRTVTIAPHLFSASFADRLPTVLDSLGTISATSAGTAMSGAANTWVQVTASTAKDYQALILVPCSDATTGINGVVRLSLGIGAAGSETELAYIQNLQASTPALSDLAGNSAFSFGLAGRFIPAGTRVAVRHNISANPDRVSACVLGVPYV